jgi:hypothetical protein
MGVLTSRERQILTLLREGSRVSDIARRFRVSQTSISRSLGNIRLKVKGLESDLQFLVDVGYLGLKNGGLVNYTRDGDPKSISRRRV